MFLNDMSTIVRFSHIFMNRSLMTSDVTSSENYILLYLFSKDKVTQEDIAAYFAIDKGSISKSVNSLVKKGYVEKIENPDNRRANLVSLTKLGRSTFEENDKLLKEWHKSVMQGITIKEFEQLKDILSRMAENARKTIETLEE